ncbi:MAG: hypothetical protein ABW123_24255 [Cystobacter sp.]
MAGQDKSRKNNPSQSHGKPSFEKDRVERHLEADSSRPLYAADSIHSSAEQKFAFDSDGPVGGPVPDLRSPIDEADEELRQRHGRTEPDDDER